MITPESSCPVIKPWPGKFTNDITEGRFLWASLAEDVRTVRFTVMVVSAAFGISLASELWLLGWGPRLFVHALLRLVVGVLCAWFVWAPYPARDPRAFHQATFLVELGLVGAIGGALSLSGFSAVFCGFLVALGSLTLTQFFSLDPRWTVLPLCVLSILFFVGRLVAGAPIEVAQGYVFGLIFVALSALGLAQASALRKARRHAFASVRAERRARLAAERSGRDFQSLFDVAPVPLAISAADTGEVLRTNHRFDVLFDVPVQRPRLQAERFYRDPADRAVFLEEVRKPGVTEFPFRAQTYDGRTLDLTTSVYSLSYVGKPSLLVGFTDRTAELRTAQALRAAKDQAEAASRLKTQFVANMSHEIRTPMNGVVAMAALLASTDLTPDQREMVQALRSSGNALLRIINDILDLSKVEAGQLALDLAPFGIRSLAKDLRAILACRAQPGVSFGMEVDSDVPEWLRGDPGRLRQVFLNLAGNALKFTPAGSVHVRIGALDRDRNNVRLVGDFRDTGVGIPEEALEGLFRPFTQARPSEVDSEGGTGLGLAISERLVEMMGGTIRVQSTVGEGSRFVVEIPFARSRPVPKRAPALLKAAKFGRSPYVLVAEDNRINQMVTQRLLDRLGARWTLAKNGQEAVEYLQARTFDLVLMDVRMPELDGLEATKWLRRYEAETGSQRTPVVALTAHALAGDRDWCLKAGMDDYLTKPIRPEHLRDVLLRWTVPPDAAGWGLLKGESAAG